LKQETPDRPYCDTACAEEGTQKRRPFLGLHPGFAVPPSVSASELKCRHAHSLSVAVGSAVADGWGVLVPSIGKDPLICRLSGNPTPVRFHAFTCPPIRHTDELFPLPFQQTCPDKTKFSRSQVQLYSLRLIFLPHIRFTAKSRAPVGSPVNPACAALRGAYTKIAPCSLPRPQAPLRSGD
jgi:hypothetical protein